jgi:hypothetical protein
MEKYEIETEFLKRHDDLLSVITFEDVRLTPTFFEENEKLVQEYVYCNIRRLDGLNITDILDLIIKLNEGYYVYLSKKPNESLYELKVFFGKEKKYSDIIFQINRLFKTKK